MVRFEPQIVGTNINDNLPLRLQLEPVLAELLRLHANPGFGGVLLSTISFLYRPFNPFTKARRELLKNGDWSRSLDCIYSSMLFWLADFQKHLAYLPTSQAKTKRYREELETSIGWKMLKVYITLWTLILISIPNEEIVTALPNVNLSEILVDNSYNNSRAIYNLNLLKEMIVIPTTTDEQINLIVDICKEIFPSWQLK